MNGGKLPGPGAHVGLICDHAGLTPAQRDQVRQELRRINRQYPGSLTLHHGCGTEADEIAHQTVRTLRGWLVHGHPAGDPRHGEVQLRPGIAHGLNKIHASKPPQQRDNDIIAASQILIVVEPRKKTSVAPPANTEIIRITPATTPKRPDQPPRRPAVGQQDLAWAKARGREDGKAGGYCPTYGAFRKRYHLASSDASLQLWHAYRGQAEHAQTATRRRKPKRTARGVPAPRRRTGPRRAQRPERRDLTPENEAALKALNTPHMLVDAWR